ncbi:DUF4362 domain-containing protein [Sporosarcina luteola]|uniref:DUF4362 domain-containing protein n=1 Tax=Sporosarcina luteola TaxID=582850 RepID=UPI00203D9076|nr:DUF4362 domain-containing protein [Sporosarcina luteola]MCM3637620.1 DUF4362 domain-containing protein [Sporosarcina luteola]
MKKLYCSFLLLTFLFILTACNASDEGKNPIDKEGSHATSNDNVKPSVKGVKNVDVLNTHGSIEGVERMKNFYDNLQNGISSDLRIVHYTIEGDPIVTDLNYKEDTIKVTYDSTRDKFGSGKITTVICNNLLEEVNPTNTSYIATGCSDGFFGMDEILEIEYNLARQDLFELELKYGEKLENEVNTKTEEVTKVINSKETRTTSDFQLSTQVKQEVFKRLVMANYLGDLDLKTTCQSEESRDYYLKVYINGGDREYHWSSCDQGSDGVKFTEIAEYIIMQSEMEQTENPETVIQGYILQVKDDTLLVGVDLNIFDYELLKDEIQNTGLDAYVFDFISLEGVNTEEFKIGDKIEAVIKGSITGSNPKRAQVKDIKKLYLLN